MVDFLKYNSSTHSIVKLEDDWNNLLDHGLEKEADVIIRKNGSYYEGIKGGSNTGAGTVVIGGQNSVAATDGTKAADVLNTARTLYNYIFIKSGIYTGLTTFWLDDKRYVTGAGPDRTILSFNLTGASNAIDFAHVSTENTHVHLKGLSIIDANKTTTGAAIYAPNTTSSIWENLNIVDFRAGTGIHQFASGSVGCYWNDFHNIRMDDVKTGFLLECDGGGMRCNANNFKLCRVNSPDVLTASVGFKIAASSGQGNSIDQCDFSNLDTGIELIDSLNYGSGGWIEACDVGIDVSTTTDCWFRNIVFTNTTTLPVDLVGGARHRFHDCYNFKQENCGSAIIANGTSTKVVAHGLINGFGIGVIPTYGNVAGTQNEVADCYISAYDATNITISTKAGANVTDDRQVYWETKYLS